MRVIAAWTLLAIYVALAAAAVALVVFQGASADALGALGFAGFAGVGTLIALRRPSNAVGWLLLTIAITFAGGEDGMDYVEEASNPARVSVAWMMSWSEYVWFWLAVVFLPLLFPHGRLPSRRWRPALWLGGAGLALGAVGSALTPGPFELREGSRIDNPLGVDGGVPEALGLISTLAQVIAVVLAAASLVVRFRRARGVERQQLKWFAYVGFLALACLSIAMVGNSLSGGDAPALTALAVVGWLTGLTLVGLGLPAATGLAILRHRLYDVDVVIRRTLVYAALTITLGATYLGLVLLVGLAVGRSGFAVAVSTLAVAALFRPALGRIQAVVDRRFYRRRYDAARTLEAFGLRLRDELDLEALAADLRGVVDQTVQPAHVSLWLRSPRLTARTRW
jgi:hypothetical protein